jgi:DNA-binding NarL/FixJ family response regulator
LMVDDHPIVREGMAQFLNLQENLWLCCQASNAREALEAMAACRHDLAIVDISLDGDSGLGLIKTLRQRYPKLAILALSMHDEAVFAERTLRAGANGYLMKQEGTRSILKAVREVLAGNLYLSAAMQGRIDATAGDLPGHRPDPTRRPERTRVGDPALDRTGPEHQGDSQKAQPQRQDHRGPPRAPQGKTGTQEWPGSGSLCGAMGGSRLTEVPVS